MAKSLQDQLLSAGLVSKDKAKQVKKQKIKSNRQQLKSKQPVVDENKERVKAQQQAQADRDRELNRQRQEELKAREIKGAIKQLIKTNRIDRTSGEEAFSFSYQSKVKKIFVTPKQFTALEKKLLAIAVLDEDFELVPAAVADKIAQRDDSLILYCADNSAAAELTEEEQDWYKDFEIPDDLDW